MSIPLLQHTAYLVAFAIRPLVESMSVGTQHGPLCVIGSGTIKSPVLRADNSDTHHMVGLPHDMTSASKNYRAFHCRSNC